MALKTQQNEHRPSARMYVCMYAARRLWSRATALHSTAVGSQEFLSFLFRLAIFVKHSVQFLRQHIFEAFLQANVLAQPKKNEFVTQQEQIVITDTRITQLYINLYSPKNGSSTKTQQYKHKY